MEFAFETVYNQKALTIMARAIRKTLRRRKSRRSHIFSWILIIMGTLLCVLPREDGYEFDFRIVITGLAVLLLLAVLIWEDAINGYVAKKRMLAGTEKNRSVFSEDGYFSVSELGETQWKYDKIKAIVETPAYFIFVFSQNHAQVYNKSGMTGGTVDEFRDFIEKKTGVTVEKMK